MKVRLLVVGKNKAEETARLMDHFIKRISRYCSFQVEVVPESRASGTTREQIIAGESELIRHKVKRGEFFILLDVEGKELSSVEFAKRIENLALKSVSNLVFVVGGAYGVSEDIKDLADLRLSLSKMTFSHQIIRVIFLEQLYRAFTIMRNEQYHH
jgi:23S rRNA (pseudouridine1915-N3)-methyltransferase